MRTESKMVWRLIADFLRSQDETFFDPGFGLVKTPKGALKETVGEGSSVSVLYPSMLRHRIHQTTIVSDGEKGILRMADEYIQLIDSFGNAKKVENEDDEDDEDDDDDDEEDEEITPQREPHLMSFRCSAHTKKNKGFKGSEAAYKAAVEARTQVLVENALEEMLPDGLAHVNSIGRAHLFPAYAPVSLGVDVNGTTSNNAESHMNMLEREHSVTNSLIAAAKHLRAQYMTICNDQSEESLTNHVEVPWMRSRNVATSAIAREFACQNVICVKLLLVLKINQHYSFQ